MCCESPREEGDIEFTVFQNSLIMELFFFFHRVFHGLNALQKHCSGGSRTCIFLLYFPSLSAIYLFHFVFTLAFVLSSSFVTCSSISFHHSTFSTYFSFFLPSFLSIPFQPSLPLLLFSPVHSLHPPSCTLSGFSGSPENFPLTGSPRGMSSLIVKYHSWK